MRDYERRWEEKEETKRDERLGKELRKDCGRGDKEAKGEERR